MSAANVSLPAEDAVELAQLLAFLHDWIEHDHARVVHALVAFLGPGYGAEELKADLARFAFLLGATDPGLVFGHEQEDER